MPTFRRFITIPFEEGGESRSIASQRLSRLLDSVCLRRTKDLLHLPDRQDTTHYLDFSGAEREQYDHTLKRMSRAIRMNAEGSDKKSLFGMFQAQLQLRLLCNHGTFQDPFSWASKRNLLSEREAALCSTGQNGEINCSSCRQPMPILETNRVYRTYAERCAHVLCLECLDGHTDQGKAASQCPLCYSLGIVSSDPAADGRCIGQGERQDDYFRPQGYSSKMAALVSDVQRNLQETKRQVYDDTKSTSDSILTSE